MNHTSIEIKPRYEATLRFKHLQHMDVVVRDGTWKVENGGLHIIFPDYLQTYYDGSYDCEFLMKTKDGITLARAIRNWDRTRKTEDFSERRSPFERWSREKK